jgi:tetratricopeptide (TPR) repeat protein
MLRKRVNEAIAHYRTALQFDPDYAEADFDLGLALVQIGETDEAIEHFKSGLKSRPRDATAHSTLADLLAGRGRIDEAVAEYEEALGIDSGNVDARRGLIRLYEAGAPARVVPLPAPPKTPVRP